MKTLKELVEIQKFTNEDDLAIITRYFVENNIEEDGMELSNRLAKAKIEKMRLRKNIIDEWTYTIPSDYLYEKYPVKTATMLHRIELDYIVNGEVTGSRLEWAKDNIPNMDTPFYYFQPCIEWMTKHGIEFKDSDKWDMVASGWED